MRTLNLLKMLAPTEIRELEMDIKKTRHKYLPALLTELMRGLEKGVKPDRPALFVKMFKRPYSKSEDYLIRNELRHLNEKIYSYLVHNSFAKHVKQNQNEFNLWLLRAYNERQSPLFWHDVDTFISRATSELKMDEVSQMYAMRELCVTHSPREISGITVKQRITRLDKWKEIEERRLLYYIRRIEYLDAYNRFPQNSLEESVWQKKKHKTSKGQTVFNLDKLADGDWYVQYLEFKKYYYQCSGSQRLVYMQKLIELSKSEKAIRILGISAHINNLAAMGLALLINGQPEGAIGYLHEAVVLTEKHPAPSRIHNYINYLAALFLLNKHEAVVDFCLKHGNSMRQSLAWPVAALTTAFSYLHLHYDDEAIALIEELPRLSGREVIVQRYVYVAMFIGRGQYDLAANELRNLKKLLSRLSPKEHTRADVHITGFYKTYIQATSEPIKTRALKLAGLKEAIAKIIDGSHTQAPPIELCWLQHYLAKTA